MILIAPDKFKGTFTASQICDMVCSRLHAAGYDGHISCRPMSDGGEGARNTFLPDSVRIDTGVYEDRATGSRLIVSSEIVGREAFAGSGIPLMRRSSIVLGRAVKPGIVTYISIGGTATSDGGAGFLQGLGVKFHDRSGNVITKPLTPSALRNVAGADTSALSRYDLKGIIDVRASLTGPGLSTLDFAPQKAIEGESLDGLADALSHLQRILGGSSPWDGAGGGLGYALASVAKAPCADGAKLAIESMGVDWGHIGLVITGEGCVDNQTVTGGKLVDSLWREASGRGIPVLVLYGRKTDMEFPYMHMSQLESRWEQAAITLVSRPSGS